MGKTILVVEDFDDSRHLMTFILASYGYRVIEAADGFEGIELFNKHRPDLILTDIAMPLMDGLTATKAIRSLDHGGVIPIIAVTAHGEHFHDKAIESGCDDLIEKPVDFDSLLTMISKYLDN